MRRVLVDKFLPRVFIFDVVAVATNLQIVGETWWVTSEDAAVI